MLRETKDMPLLPLYNSHSNSSSRSPSPTRPPPLYSPSNLNTNSTTYPIIAPFHPSSPLSRTPSLFHNARTTRSAKRRSLDPSPKDRSWNRRKAFICIAVGVVVLLVLPLSVFGGILHATRRNGECKDGNTGFLDGVKVCET